jgi:hypothetical protein
MKKIAVLIPFHTYPEVLFLTLGTLLRKVAPNYELSIHVGIHSNYNHYYHGPLGFFDRLRKIAQIHTVDEIDWLGEYNDHWFRYSVMHAKHLVNLFKNVYFSEFDYLLILDNDLLVKHDFVTECLKRYPEADLFGSYFADRNDLNEITREKDGLPIYVLPKLSGWHVMLSRKLFLTMATDYGCVYPSFMEGDVAKPYLDTYKPPKTLPIFSDVMGLFFHMALHRWKVPFGSVPTADFANWVHHFSESSFNFGERSLKNDYRPKIREIAAQYAAEFPKGLEEFL